ncbi:MAG: TatD family hydrolase [Hyphomicrobiaceae bacterium]
MLVDHHCHLDFDQFANDRDDLVARAEAAGVEILVSISTRIAHFDELLETIAPYPNVYCSIGTHPHHADKELGVPVERIVELSEHPRVIAIGEAGLDYHYDNSPRKAQAEGFRRHIAAARETGLPLVIHTREADEDTASILEEEMSAGPFSAVLHCFTAGRDLAERGLALGLYVSFSGVITFKNSDELRAIARDVPMERLLVETDAPFLAPVPHRGKRNEPAFVRHTAECLAEVKGVSLDQLAEATTENFFRLYTKVPRPGRRADAAA